MHIFIKNCCNWLFQRLNIVANLAAENIALRHQLAVLNREQKHPRLKERDRLFWIFLSHIWSGWRNSIKIVQPDTVVRWHKKSFKKYWWRKSQRGKQGRPSIDPEIKKLVIKMANANPLWGAPRIHGELLKLGVEISERTVSGLIGRRARTPPCQTRGCTL